MDPTISVSAIPYIIKHYYKINQLILQKIMNIDLWLLFFCKIE